MLKFRVQQINSWKGGVTECSLDGDGAQVQYCVANIRSICHIVVQLTVETAGLLPLDLLQTWPSLCVLQCWMLIYPLCQRSHVHSLTVIKSCLRRHRTLGSIFFLWCWSECVFSLTSAYLINFNAYLGFCARFFEKRGRREAVSHTDENTVTALFRHSSNHSLYRVFEEWRLRSFSS